MITFTGKGAFGGYAMGQILFYNRIQTGIKAHTVDDPISELERFFAAQKTAIEQLGELYEKALLEVGRSSAMIFQIHQMMLEDVDYVGSITNMIQNQGQNAEYAVSVTAAKFANMFATMDDPYMRERSADVKDISQRLINVLTHNHDGVISFEKPVIIAANDLVPSEIMQLDKDKVLAFVTCHGSINSHTAILARIMNIPAVVNLGTDFTKEYDGREAIVDGYNGKLIISPNQEATAYYTKKQMQEKANRALLREQLGKDNVTQDGRKIHIVLKNREIEFYDKIDTIRGRLPEYFILIHKSSIINRNHVRKYTYETAEMSNDKILSISKPNRKDVREHILNQG